jgi:glucosylceramidase
MDRRDFVALGALSLTAMLLTRSGFAENSDPVGTRVWLTDPDHRHQEIPANPWKPEFANARPDLIVDDTRRYQPMLGFGGAFTDGSCYLLSRLSSPQRSSFLKELLSPDQMNLSVGRCCIGASDYSTSLYNLDDVPDDIALKHFSIGHDQEYILPVLREARAIRPDLFLHASPWSPPGWMKVYGSMDGGWMSQKYLAPYAGYLIRFLQEYRAAGVPIQAICTQNEVETDQHGMMPACFWTPEMEAEFIRDHLGPGVRAQKDIAATKIWLLDYNYILWKRPDWQLQDKKLAQYVDGVAFHGYEGKPEQMSELERRHPDVPLYFTEWSSTLTTPYATDWATWGHNLAEILQNWVRNITLWNVLLDEKGHPDIGPYNCVGMVTLNSKTGMLERNGQYWALYHYSAHIQRNARRIHTEAGDTDFTHIAFRNPNGEIALVLTNQAYPRSVIVRHKDRTLNVHLPADSVTTVTWKGTSAT